MFFVCKDCERQADLESVSFFLAQLNKISFSWESAASSVAVQRMHRSLLRFRGINIYSLMCPGVVQHRTVTILEHVVLIVLKKLETLTGTSVGGQDKEYGRIAMCYCNLQYCNDSTYG